jgi:glycosyltransferase involved in cell wall biosynthesis
VVLYPARSLAGYVEGLGPRRALHFPNGVDFGHFAGGSRHLPPEYRAIPAPRVVYVGAMEAWFDYELLAQAARALPHASFVLIGPDANARRRLAPEPNVHLLGPRPHGELPRYLHNAQVGIIPFDADGHPELVHGINPLKLYEYMACGLPVVATAWRELHELGSPARLCGSRAEFVAALRDAIAAGGDPTTFVRYAARMDWGRRVRELVEGLGVGRA